MTAADFAVLAAYFAAAVGLAWFVGRGRTERAEWMLGHRELPTWAVLLSMSATELSAATFIGVPQAAFAGDWSFLQLAFGALIGKLVLARWIIPMYHAMRVVTVYGYLSHRYGWTTRWAAAAAFCCGRVLASGVRLFIAALGFSLVSGLSLEGTIVVCGVVAALYTTWGGIRAVIWTDVLQAAVLLAGGLALLASIAIDAHSGSGGWMAPFTWAATEGKLEVFHLDPLISLSQSTPFGVAIIGGMFLTLATHSTDHDMVQRLLTTRDGRSGGRALAASALLNFPLTLLFLAIGSGIAFAAQLGTYVPPDDARQVMPAFALEMLPAGARGLVFAGLFAAAMSSLDSAICAITATLSEDVLPTPTDTADSARRTRLISAVVSTALIASAIAMSAFHRTMTDTGTGLSLVEFALSAMTILYGGLLGVFGFGWISSGRGDDQSATWGLLAGSVSGLALFLHPVALGETIVAWQWWIPISATISFAVTATRRATPGAA